MKVTFCSVDRVEGRFEILRVRMTFVAQQFLSILKYWGCYNPANFSKELSHEYFMLLEYLLDSIKFVDFLLIAKFLGR